MSDSNQDNLYRALIAAFKKSNAEEKSSVDNQQQKAEQNQQQSVKEAKQTEQRQSHLTQPSQNQFVASNVIGCSGVITAEDEPMSTSLSYMQHVSNSGPYNFKIYQAKIFEKYRSGQNVRVLYVKGTANHMMLPKHNGMLAFYVLFPDENIPFTLHDRPGFNSLVKVCGLTTTFTDTDGQTKLLTRLITQDDVDFYGNEVKSVPDLANQEVIVVVRRSGTNPHTGRPYFNLKDVFLSNMQSFAENKNYLPPQRIKNYFDPSSDFYIRPEGFSLISVNRSAGYCHYADANCFNPNKRSGKSQSKDKNQRPQSKKKTDIF